MRTPKLAFAMIVTIAFFSCKEDPNELIPSAPVKQQDVGVSEPVTTLSPTLGALIQTYIPSTGGCKSPAAKCINGRPTVTDTYAENIATFDDARQSSPTALADLLTANHDLALVVFPDWDNPFMISAKGMILSGEYFLLKKVSENKFFYVLTQETSNDALVDEVLENDTYAYVFSYEL